MTHAAWTPALIPVLLALTCLTARADPGHVGSYDLVGPGGVSGRLALEAGNGFQLQLVLDPRNSSRPKRMRGTLEVDGRALSYRVKPKQGLVGALTGAEPGEGAKDEIRVTLPRSNPGTQGDSRFAELRVWVRVGGREFELMGSRASETHDLRRAIRDYPSDEAELTLSLDHPSLGSMSVTYERAVRGNSETRSYTQLVFNGESELGAGPVQQTLSGSDPSGWTPDPPNPLSSLEGKLPVVKSTYTPLPVTPLMAKERVAVGESWEVPPTEVATLMQIPHDALEPGGQARGTLVSVERLSDRDGDLKYRIKITSVLTAKGGMKVKIALDMTQTPTVWEVKALAKAGGQTIPSRFMARNAEPWFGK